MFTGPGRIIRKRKPIVSTITTGGIAKSYSDNCDDSDGRVLLEANSFHSTALLGLAIRDASPTPVINLSVSHSTTAVAELRK
jgi:hypothetical protein